MPSVFVESFPVGWYDTLGPHSLIFARSLALTMKYVVKMRTPTDACASPSDVEKFLPVASCRFGRNRRSPRKGKWIDQTPALLYYIRRISKRLDGLSTQTILEYCAGIMLPRVANLLMPRLVISFEPVSYWDLLGSAKHERCVGRECGSVIMT